jgi:TolB-like protein
MKNIVAVIGGGSCAPEEYARAREVGKMTGMQLLLSGNLSDSGGRQRIDVKVVDVGTGEAVLAEMVDGVVDADRAGFLARLVAKGLAERYYGGE